MWVDGNAMLNDFSFPSLQSVIGEEYYGAVSISDSAMLTTFSFPTLKEIGPSDFYSEFSVSGCDILEKVDMPALRDLPTLSSRIIPTLWIFVSRNGWEVIRTAVPLLTFTVIRAHRVENLLLSGFARFLIFLMGFHFLVATVTKYVALTMRKLCVRKHQNVLFTMVNLVPVEWWVVRKCGLCILNDR